MIFFDVLSKIQHQIYLDFANKFFSEIQKYLFQPKPQFQGKTQSEMLTTSFLLKNSLRGFSSNSIQPLRLLLNKISINHKSLEGRNKIL